MPLPYHEFPGLRSHSLSTHYTMLRRTIILYQTRPMSEATIMPTESPVIIWIIADHTQAINALASFPTDSLDAVTLHANYEGAVNLAHTLNTSENLTNWFTTLTTENEELSLERDTAIANQNALTTYISQLEAQLT
jgi:hypothetical protein